MHVSGRERARPCDHMQTLPMRMHQGSNCVSQEFLCGLTPVDEGVKGGEQSQYVLEQTSRTQYDTAAAGQLVNVRSEYLVSTLC